LQALFARVREDFNVDLRDYRDNTFVRQLMRRMGERGVDSLEAYAALLDQDPDELRELRRCVLVSVTSFFRDPPVFDELATWLRHTLTRRAAGEPLRIWVPGCATGQEAYSIAILLLEVMAQLGRPVAARVFATDVDSAAITSARSGRFEHEALAGLSAERRARHFSPVPGGMVVNANVRDLCVFAEHDLLTQTGFAKLDLVACRNVLIYFHGPAREAVLTRFALALRPGGGLLLGQSERLTPEDSRFAAEGQEARLYRRRGSALAAPAGETHTALTAPPGLGTGWGLSGLQHDSRARRQALQNSSEAALHRALLQRDALPSLLVDSQGQVLQMLGDLAPYLQLGSGHDLSLLNVLRPELRNEALGLMHLARQPGSGTVRSARLQLAPPAGQLRLLAQPLVVPGQTAWLLLSFQPAHDTPASADGSPGDTALAAELHALREDLALAREQAHTLSRLLEHSDSARRSVSEELQVSTEELQASNEELQASNEELMSLNEQLVAKSDELGELNDLLMNVERSVNMAMVVLDTQLCVQRFNPLAVRLFGLLPSDVGRPLALLPGSRLLDQLPLQLASVARDGQALVAQVAHGEQRLVLQIAPLRDRREALSGLILALTDISDLHRAEIQSSRLAAIVASSDDAIVGKTLDGTITSWNPGAERLFGHSAEEAVGRPMLIVFPDHLRYQESELLARVGRGETVPPFDTQRLHKRGHVVHVSVTLSPIRDAQGRIVGVSKIARDIGDRVADEASRTASMERLEEQVARRTSELTASRAFVQSVLEDVPGYVAYWDASLQPRLANGAQQRLLDALAQDQACPLALALHPARCPAAAPHVQQVLGGVPASFELGPLQDDEGRPLHLSVSYRPHRNEGVVEGFVALAFDISPIRAAQAEAAAASRAKSNFLASISHEIRTPLNAVLGLAQVGLRTSRAPEQHDIHERILHAGQHLLELINDVLDFSRIEADKLVLHQGRITLDTLVARVVGMVDMQAQAKGLRLRVQRDPHLHTAYLGDGMRLSQILINLLVNAVKFTHSGEVCLHIAPEGPGLRFAVSDTGVGIDDELRQRLFNPFERGDHGRTRRTGGTGLGLAICKRLVDLMGGSIQVQARPGQGTCFTVSLPGLLGLDDARALAAATGLPLDHPAVRAAPAAPEHSQRLQGVRVLAAEDNPTNVIVLERMLALEGAWCQVAENGRLALAAYDAARLLEKTPFDVVLCDIEMPELDGYETTRQLLLRDPGLPVIGLTAHTFDDARQAGLAAGMVGHLTKPVLMDHLVAEIRRVLLDAPPG
jgi:two-component system CheB/CheR fusion protein